MGVAFFSCRTAWPVPSNCSVSSSPRAGRRLTASLRRPDNSPAAARACPEGGGPGDRGAARIPAPPAVRLGGMFMLLVRAVPSRPWLDLPREIIPKPRPYSSAEERAVIKIGNAAPPASDADNRRAELELARRARRGDAAAFDELVRRFHRPVHRFCWRLLRSADAEDLAQDTFVRAFLHFERFDPERPVLPWLIAIARRLCLDLLRRRKVMIRAETVLITGPPAPGPEGEASIREQLSRLDQALADLDEGPREAIVLFHIEEMSYRDIAAALEVPMGTVMTWLHRGRAQLKKAVDGDPTT